MSMEKLHLLLLEAFLRSNRQLSQQLPQVNLLPGQPKILEFLLGNDGCTQRTISEGCFLDKSTITTVLKRMEKDKLIYKKPHPTDQRSSLIYLTENGSEKALWIHQVLSDIDKDELTDIPETECKQFLTTLKKIIENQKKW